MRCKGGCKVRMSFVCRGKQMSIMRIMVHLSSSPVGIIVTVELWEIFVFCLSTSLTLRLRKVPFIRKHST